VKINGFIWIDSIIEKLKSKHLVVFFIHKKDGHALILSARDMTRAERRKYEQK